MDGSLPGRARLGEVHLVESRIALFSFGSDGSASEPDERGRAPVAGVVRLGGGRGR
jgi:hypothetical protein